MLAEIQYAKDIDLEWDNYTDFENILQDLYEKFPISSNSDSPNPLIEATKNGNLDKIKELIKNGANVNFILILASEEGP